jgi:hypothetical protein
MSGETASSSTEASLSNSARGSPGLAGSNVSTWLGVTASYSKWISESGAVRIVDGTIGAKAEVV